MSGDEEKLNRLSQAQARVAEWRVDMANGPEGSGKLGWHFDKNVSINMVFFVLCILGFLIIASWDRGARLEALERNIIVVERLDKTISRLEQQLEDFPHHRHYGSNIMYPGKHTEGDERRRR